MSDGRDTRLVLEAFAAFGRGDIDAVVTALDAAVEVQFYGPEVIPFAGRYQGPAGFLEYLGRVNAAIEFLEFEPHEALEQDGRVVVLGHSLVRGRASGRTARYEWATVFDLDGGRIRRYRVYEDTAALAGVLASAG